MKKPIIRMGFIILLGFMVGCSRKIPDKQAEGEVKTQKIQIGISFDTYVLERWSKDRDIFVSTANKMGAQVDVQSANGSVEEQIDQIENFVQAGKDVIVIIPVDCEKLTAAVRKAKEAEIKVISYDRIVLDGGSDLYISFDNEAVGRLMAEALIERLPEGGNVKMICGPQQDYNSILVANGFEEKIKESNLSITGKDYVKDWTPEYGFDVIDAMAETDISQIDAIMCGNDGLAGYAIRSLAEQRLAGQILTVGQDADLDACQRIVEGTQTMTVYKDVESLAKKAAEYAVMLGQGLSLTAVDEVFDDGSYQVPYEALEPEAVTRENMKQLIIETKGFHTEDQVYLNIREGEDKE